MTDSDPFAPGIEADRIVVVAQPSPGGGVEGLPGGRMHRVNDWLAFWLVAIVALAPVPIASNRPPFWMIWAAIIGLIGIWYGLRLLILRTPPRVAISVFRREAWLFALVLVYALVQILPIGRYVSIILTLPQGGELTSQTLSLTPGDTLLMLISMVGYGVFFLLFAQVAANRHRAGVLLAVIFTFVVSFAILGLISLNFFGDTLLGFEKTSYLGSATGTFINRNSYATFLASALPVGVVLLLDAARPQPGGGGGLSPVMRIAAVGLGMLFIGAALIATGSRMGLFAGAVGSALALVLGAVTMKGAGRAALVLFVVGALAGVALLFGYGSGLFERVLFVSSASEDRTEVYREVAGAILARPLLGYGGSSFITVFPLFQAPPVDGSLVWNKAHSTYLALWFEMGIVAGSGMILIVLSLVWRALMAMRHPAFVVTSIAAVGSVAVFAVHSIVDFSLEIQANVYLMLAVLALGAAKVPARAVRGEAK